MELVQNINKRLPKEWGINTVWFWAVVGAWILSPILWVINIIAWIVGYGNYYDKYLNAIYGHAISYIAALVLSILLTALIIIYRGSREL